METASAIELTSTRKPRWRSLSPGTRATKIAARDALKASLPPPNSDAAKEAARARVKAKKAALPPSKNDAAKKAARTRKRAKRKARKAAKAAAGGAAVRDEPKVTVVEDDGVVRETGEGKAVEAEAVKAEAVKAEAPETEVVEAETVEIKVGEAAA